MNLETTDITEGVRNLLKTDPVCTLSISGILYNTDPEFLEIKVDDPRDPGVVLLKSAWNYFYSEETGSAKKILNNLPPAKECNFAGLDERFYQYIDEEFNWSEKCKLYYFPESEIPEQPDHEIRTLEEKYVSRVAKHWEHGDEDSTDYVVFRLRHGPTCAIYKEDEPVSWALTHRDGQMGFMHTLEEYRGCGFAKSITYVLTEKILKSGKTPFLHTVADNSPAQKLVESCGFQYHGIHYYLSLNTM